MTALIGFISRDHWPQEAVAGDVYEMEIRREPELWEHTHWRRLDSATKRGVRNFFANGGQLLHIYGLCIEAADDLKTPDGVDALFVDLGARLAAMEEIALIVVPAAAYLSCTVSRLGEVVADVEPLYNYLLEHCHQMRNRFLILDPPKGLHDDLLRRWLKRFREDIPKTRSFGALYYPWLNDGADCFPPSSSMAGAYARIERQNGVYGVLQPPANIELEAVTHLELELNWDEVDALIQANCNPLILQSGRGIVVFGARTLSIDEAFKFINTRRVANLVTEQLWRDNRWAVFESNNPHLWSALDRDVRFRLEMFWEAGLLAGDHPGDQYTVKCSDVQNSLAQIDKGVVSVEVTMRPIGTAEQIVIDLTLGTA